MARSLRPEVRNPILGLPAAAALHRLHPEVRAALGALLRELSADAAQRAESAWRKHKGPMAAYWRSVAVYSKHISRALGRRR
jgi:hypothetical protein